MKHRFVWASAVALAATITSQAETPAITNGVVIITTRSAQDAYWRQQSSSGLWDGDDYKGPGIFSPGDAAMGILLQDNGYVTRMVPEKVLTCDAQSGEPTLDWNGDFVNPLTYYQGGGGPTASTTTNVLWSAMLVIVSGSGSSADMPPPNTNGIPIIMGEHSCLGNNAPRDHSQLFLYGNKTSANLGLANNPGLYMKVMAPNHPIMQGIPLDANGRVKIFRDPYPEENLHIDVAPNPAGKPNYEISWTAVDCSETKSVPAPGLNIIGVLDSNPNQVVFAVMEAGAQLAENTDDLSQWSGLTTAPARLVHFFVNEGGSGNSRRAFNALTVWGRIIFVRTCKWAMGETLQPYQGLGIIDVSQVGLSRIKLAWQGSIDKNYSIDGTTDFVNWQPVVDSIVGGVSGTVSRTLEISGGPQAAYLRVAAVP
jgi:hypothetical protein